MINPEQLAACGTESGHQKALMCWRALHVQEYPELALLHAIPNGGARDKVTGARMKAEGVKPGVSDLMLPVARGLYHGLYLEMKKPGVVKMSDAQREWGHAVVQQGYAFACVNSWEKARDFLIRYLMLD